VLLVPRLGREVARGRAVVGRHRRSAYLGNGEPDGDRRRNWESAAGADIFGNGSTDSGYDAVTSNVDGRHGAEFGAIADAGVIAVTYTWGVFGGPPKNRQLVEWDMIFDSDSFSWSTTGAPGTTDFRNIDTHELGHAMGLGHPSNTCTEETMYAFASLGETKKRDLNAGDIAGINGLY
jgi:hypothetical protein